MVSYFTIVHKITLVIYTAYNFGQGVHKSGTSSKNRARQNIVFEHGYLMAKLGRKNVCSLVKVDIETPNDISGVVYVSLDLYVAWKNEVDKDIESLWICN